MENKSLLLVIDSKDRSSGNEAKFNYVFDQLPVQKVKKFRINKIVIPYTFYVLPQQTFIFWYNAGSYNINVPAGNYNNLSLAITIENLINNAVPAPGIVITYNQNTNKYLFTATGGNVIQFDFSSVTVPANQNLGVSLGMILPSDTGLVIAPATVVESIYQAYLVSTKALYLKSSALRLYNTSYFQNKLSNVIQTIPINVNSYNMIIWENISPIIFYYSEQTICNLDFELCDDYGNTINLNNYSFIIELEAFTNIEI